MKPEDRKDVRQLVGLSTPLTLGDDLRTSTARDARRTGERLASLKGKRAVPVDRAGIEKARIRVTFACLLSAVERGQRKPPVRYLWWPDDNIHRYELRDGNPPADVDRPPYLRGHHLAIDLGVIPKEVWDAVKAQRKRARSSTAEPTRIIDVVDDPRVVQHIATTSKALPKG